MRRETLLDFFEDFATSDDTFLVHDDGYRTRRLTYRQVAAGARRFAARLERQGVRPDEKVVIWSENRAEWVVALWGCLLADAVVVPVDYRASGDLLGRIAGIVKAALILVGDEVDAAAADGLAPMWRLSALETEAEGQAAPARVSAATGTTLAEIIFTSGATADPKGVTITHRNVLANIVPIEREVKKYLRYERPFHPIRFLNLLPLSHLFGQSMATFVPPMLRGTVVFSHGYSPAEILHQIKSRRISVLVSVPKVLDVLREHVERVAPETRGPDALVGKPWPWRWWHYRRVHRLFGWKFWAVVVGAAPLEADLEAFWRKLGFVVVQGYGLTETAPIVTLNHPFHPSRGTVGVPIAGVDVKIASDGEVLVRGDNVTSGYYTAAGRGDVDTSAAFDDGWFHTGDIGEIDANGRLAIKGRKKEMIVTPQGLNVFPEDVERALVAQPGVRDAAVVGLRKDGEERIHAVLIVDPGASLDTIVRDANARLEDHQRVWSTSFWPGPSLPRTEGTQKLKRREIQRWAAGEPAAGPAQTTDEVTVAAVLARFAAGRDITDETTLEALGLSSLDRVEFLMALEDAFQVTVDETFLTSARTVGEIAALVGPRAPGAGVAAVESADLARGSDDALAFPAWNQWAAARLLRRVSLPTWILPLARVFLKMRVTGLEHLSRPRWAGDLRGQPSEPSRCADAAPRAAFALALPHVAGHVAGVLSRPFRPPRRRVGPLSLEQPDLCRRLPVLQCLSALAGRQRNPADHPLRRRPGGPGHLDSHLSRGALRRADCAVSRRRRHDRLPHRLAGRARSNWRARPRAPPEYALAQAGPRDGSVRPAAQPYRRRLRRLVAEGGGGGEGPARPLMGSDAPWTGGRDRPPAVAYLSG